MTPMSGSMKFRWLERVIRQPFPVLADVPIMHGWAGQVGVTLDSAPTVGAFGPADNILSRRAV